MKNTHPIPYQLKRSRRARRIRITVRCDASVFVTAPHFFPRWMVACFVARQSDWIRRARERMRKNFSGWISFPAIAGERFAACREKALAFVLELANKQNAHYGFSYGRIMVKNMRSRWGSCSSRNNLNFHYRLLFLPVGLAEYVVAHELCHLKHMDHSKEFWRLVAETVPDYQKKRVELRRYRL